MARTGTGGGHVSGDILLAFSTADDGVLNSTFPQGEPVAVAYGTLRFAPWGRIAPFGSEALPRRSGAVGVTRTAGRTERCARVLSWGPRAPAGG
ncbi:hypothetical protein [Streptomyces sp. NPDC059762]|uniref:hypothetical protein n=1 Tax=Streptomyces sp. NPDC059762 TaxID=3346938 RepID=UPI00364C2614